MGLQSTDGKQQVENLVRSAAFGKGTWAHLAV